MRVVAAAGFFATVAAFGTANKNRAPDYEFGYVEVINMDFEKHHSPIQLHIRAPNDGWAPNNPEGSQIPMVGDLLVFDNQLRTNDGKDLLHGKTRGVCTFASLEDDVTGESATTICEQNFRWETGPYAGSQIALQPIAALAGALPVDSWVSEHAVMGGTGMFIGAFGTSADVDVTGDDGTDAWKSVWSFKVWLPDFDVNKPDFEIAYVEVINMDFEKHHSPLPLHIRAPNDGWSPSCPDCDPNPMVGDNLIFDNELRTLEDVSPADVLHGRTRGTCRFASLDDTVTKEPATTICHQNFRWETGPYAGAQIASQPIAAIAGALPVESNFHEHVITGGTGIFTGAFGVLGDVDATKADGVMKSIWSFKIWLPKFDIKKPTYTIPYIEVINMDFEKHHSPIPLHIRAPNDGWAPGNPDGDQTAMVGDKLVFDNQLRTEPKNGDILHGKTRGVCTFASLEDAAVGPSTTICNQNFRWETGPYAGAQLATMPIAALAGALPVTDWVSSHAITGGVGMLTGAYGYCTDEDVTGQDGTEAWKSLWICYVWIN